MTLLTTITVTDDLGYYYQTRGIVADEATAQRDAEELLSRIRVNHPSAHVAWRVEPKDPTCAERIREHHQGRRAEYLEWRNEQDDDKRDELYEELVNEEEGQ